MSVPLHSIEAEMSLLGSMFLYGKLMPEVDAIVDAEDFFRPAHQTIFKAIQSCGKFGADQVTIINKLKENGSLTDCGGIDYIVQISEYVPSAANASYYAQIVADKAVMRRMNHACTEIQGIIQDPEIEGIEDRILKATEVFETAKSRKKIGSFTSLSTFVMESSNRVDALLESGAPIRTGATTGFDSIDEIIHGLMPGKFIIIGARPSMGKTAKATQLAVTAAKAGFPVAFYSAEMDGASITDRLVAQIAGYPVSIFNSQISNEKIVLDLSNAMEELYGLPVGIDEASDPNPDQFMAQCRAFQKENGGGHCIFILDYLQYVTKTRKGETQNDATTRVSRICKNVAKTLGCTFIALSQLSRDLEKRDDKRPHLSDLRDSGSLEQDADVVAFLYRDEYYRAKKEHRAEAYQSDAEFIVAKHRNGKLGTAKLAFRPSQTKFLSVKE